MTVDGGRMLLVLLVCDDTVKAMEWRKRGVS
jgi:hypothetical protein